MTAALRSVVGRGGRLTHTAWALLLTALACDGGDAACAGAQACGLDGPLEVATWWEARGETSEPFDILKQSYRDATGRDVQLAHTEVTKSEHMRWIERQLDPATPDPARVDVFSANNGDEVMTWTTCPAWGPAPGEVRLVPLTDPSVSRLSLDENWIEATFQPEVMDSLRCQSDGQTYALPVGIHRINTLFFNKDLFRRAGYVVDSDGGRPLPSTLDELRDAAERVTAHLPPADAGDDLIPSAFAVAGREPWTLSLFIIENLMLALAANRDEYVSYWTGETCNEDLLRRTLAELALLKPYFGRWTLDANDAIQRVANGQAAMMVTGDWARAEVMPEAVGTIPFPQTDQYFVFTADVFALPAIASANPDSGLAWLRGVTAASTQREFSNAKKALPARVDLEEELYASRGAASSWVPSLPALLPYYPGAPFTSLQTELKTWLDSGDDSGERILDYAREQYPLLSHGDVICPPPPGSEVMVDPTTIE